VLLDGAQSIVGSNADSAYTLLELIEQPTDLDKEDFWLYNLLKTQAKYNSGQDISSDTIIREVKEHYTKKNDINRGALSAYLYAQVLKKQALGEKAIVVCLDAEKMAEQTDDTDLKGEIQFLIADLHIINFMDEEAIPYMKKAAQYFHEVKNSSKEMQALRDVAMCYIIIKATEYEKGNKEDKNFESDSALVYCDKALKIASALNDSIRIADLLMNKGTVCSMQNDNWKAKQFFYQAKPFFAAYSSEDLIKSLNLAALFYDKNEADSAIFYVNKSREIADQIQLDNPYFYASQYTQLADFYEIKKDYKKELEYRKLSLESRHLIYEDMHSEELLDIQEKYRYQADKNANSKLKIQTQYLSIILLAVIFIIILVAFFIYYRKQRYEKELLEIRQKVYDLRQMADDYNEKIESSRNILLNRFETLKKSALLESYLRDDEKQKGHKLLKKFNEIVYQDSSFNWDILYTTINELHDGFFEKINSKYPSLDDVEFKICCLIYIGFSNSEISVLLGKSISTIVAKRTLIRKKMGMREHANIVNFLENEII